MTFPFRSSASCLSPASSTARRRELPWAKWRSREAREEDGPQLGSRRGTRAGERCVGGGGAGAMRKGSKAGRVCGREGKKGQIAVVRRRKGNARNREVGARNRA